MQKPRILVTGATGKTGGAVVTHLLEQNWPVRAVVHTRDARSRRLEGLGAEIAVADLFDGEQLEQAMRGTARAYLCLPIHVKSIGAADIFIGAAKAAKLESVVTLSQWLASADHPSALTREHWLFDNRLAGEAGMAVTIVNPGYFADNTLRLIDFAAHLGILPSLTGDSRNAPPSNEDIARVAVAALIDPSKHDRKRYRPTGPALLSTRDMAQILSQVLNRPVRKLEMPWWLFVKAARLQGVSAFELLSLRDYLSDHKSGAFEFGAPTDDVLRVTGRMPEDFATIARRYAAEPAALRNFANGSRMFLNFMRTPMSPGYNLDRFARAHKLLRPQHPKYAMENERWKKERAVQIEHHDATRVSNDASFVTVSA